MTEHLDLLELLSPQIRNGSVSSREVIESYLRRIEDRDGRLGAYVEVCSEQALARADILDGEIAHGQWRGPLHGMPIAVKDLIQTQGVRTTLGTAFMADWVPDVSATVIERLEQAGAIIIGKVKLTEAASLSHHPAYAPPLNPWSASHSCGASSSGSGVAVAAGMCIAALGTDTGGSIRFPSMANGVVGVTPTWGRVSRHGVFPGAEQLDVVGPMARSAAGVAALLSAMAGSDPRDPSASSLPAPNYLSQLDAGISGVDIALDEAALRRDTDSAVGNAVMDAAEMLARLGARIRKVTLPDLDPAKSCVQLAAGYARAHRTTFPAHRAEYGPDLVAMIEEGQRLSGMDVIDAINAANILRAQLEDLFRGVDLLLVPAMAMLTPKVGVFEDWMRSHASEGMAMMRYTVPFNTTGNPTITFPAGMSDALPVGVQLVGRHFDEGMLLRAVAGYQSITDWHVRVP